MLGSRLLFSFLVSRARAARTEGRLDAAALLYGEALRFQPAHRATHIQRGHMLKETGQIALAEQHYLEAERLQPGDPDLALQLGHFYKVAFRLGESRRAYEAALSARPGWAEPLRELAWLDERETHLIRDEKVPAAGPAVARDGVARRSAAELARLVPALVPKRYEDLLLSHREEVAVRTFGRRETGYWGNRRTLRGVEAIRGFCVSSTPVLEVQVLLNGIRIHRGRLTRGYVLKLEQDKDRVRKYVFNEWLDFSGYAPGLYSVELRFFDADERSTSFHDDVVIAPAQVPSDDPGSDFLVDVSPDDPRPLEVQIRSAPSMVRSARRALFPNGVASVLVMRTDQLGDMVASIAAMRRLREMLPDARMVGLFGAANAELAGTLGLFDEIIVIDFPDDPLERRRLMPLDAQEALRLRLQPFAFDIAIDLAQASVSRDLLRLAGAKFTFGTGGEDWPWLSSDFLFHTRDRWNRHDFTPHSTKVLALVESLGTLLKTSAPIIRRADLSRDVLAPYGIEPDERFAVLHTGARIGFSRWPHYGELARRLLAETDVKLVIITEDPGFRATLPDDILADPRVIFLNQRLPFDHFDAFLSFAAVMVGNDSGPKHLASLRGTNVVTIFSARINWSEWGQENVGVIVSRRLPCAGCALLHDAEECGRDFICVSDISAQDVFDAMMLYLAPQVTAA